MPRGGRGDLEASIPSSVTQVEGLFEFFFLTPPFKFGIGGSIEDPMELLLPNSQTMMIKHQGDLWLQAGASF